MININTAKTPWGFTFFSFFFVSTFFSPLLQETPPPPYFHWNYNIDNKNNTNFVWNNSISSKNKKEERKHNVNLYIKLSEVI